MIAQQVRFDCDDIASWLIPGTKAGPWLIHHRERERDRDQPHCPAREKTWLEVRFAEEAEKWDRETAHLSSTPRMVLHDSYQAIMAMGPDVVPILLRDLQENQRAWFWALRHLTGADPVAPADRGNMSKMIAAWLDWGRRGHKI